MADTLKKSDKLFVYGTLLRDTENPMSAYLKSKSTFVNEGTMSGKLFKVDFYPGAVFLPESNQKVHGEIYSIQNPEEVFEVLDTYENYTPQAPEQSLFTRKVVPVNVAGETVYCWAYLYNHRTEGLKQLDSGYFLE
ncbi:MAG: gamma-glutamylcyclotransferase family protein [Bacteroidia bacterium]|nr:gamma-glutamylcyclotransferase family protein [Bacteroidia bacterium]